MTNQEGALSAVRDVDLGDWGRVLLEEILFRAARDISEQAAAAPNATVTLEFRLTPDETTRTIEICTPGAVEAVIRTRLPMEG